MKPGKKQIVNLQKQVSNQSESLRLAKEVFTLQQDELKKSDKLLQVQINETLKYKRRELQWPIWLGGNAYWSDYNMSSIDQIVKGTVNNIFNRKDGLYKSALAFAESAHYIKKIVFGERFVIHQSI